MNGLLYYKNIIYLNILFQTRIISFKLNLTKDLIFILLKFFINFIKILYIWYHFYLICILNNKVDLQFLKYILFIINVFQFYIILIISNLFLLIFFKIQTYYPQNFKFYHKNSKLI